MLPQDFYRNGLTAVMLIGFLFILVLEALRLVRHRLPEWMTTGPLLTYLISDKILFTRFFVAIILSYFIGFTHFDRLMEKNQQSAENKQEQPCDPAKLCVKIDSIANKLDKMEVGSTDDAALKELEDQVKQLIDKLEERTTDDATPQREKSDARPSALSITMIVLGIFAFILFAAAAFVRPDFSNWKAIGAVSSLLTLSGVGLYAVENFKGEFKFFERRIYNAPASQPQPQLNGAPRVGIEHIGEIRNFQVGRHDRFESNDLQRLKDSIITKGVSVLFLIGEVDRRELKEPAKKMYGSNLSLARARAEHIKTLLETFCDQHKISVITMNRGALYTGGEDIEQKFSDDRQVVVYGLTTSSN